MTQTPPISAEQVEAAAKSAFRAAQTEYRAEHDHFPMRHTWETTSEVVRKGWRDIAIASLTAAASIPASRGVETEGAWEKEVLAAMVKHLSPKTTEALTYEHGPYSITKVRNEIMTFASALRLSAPEGPISAENQHINASNLVVPEGWVLVPKIPTKAMIEAAQQHKHDMWSHQVEGAYAAMLAASPAQPVQEQEPVAYLWECIDGPYKGEIDVHSRTGVDDSEVKRVAKIYGPPFAVYRVSPPEQEDRAEAAEAKVERLTGGVEAVC